MSFFEPPECSLSYRRDRGYRTREVIDAAQNPGRDDEVEVVEGVVGVQMHDKTVRRSCIASPETP